VTGATAAAKRIFAATYKKGYVAHAALEPHAALAEIKNGKVTVWASTPNTISHACSNRQRPWRRSEDGARDYAFSRRRIRRQEC